MFHSKSCPLLLVNYMVTLIYKQACQAQTILMKFHYRFCKYRITQLYSLQLEFFLCLFVFGSSIASRKVSWITLNLQYFFILWQRIYKELKYIYNFYKSYIQVHMMLILPYLIALALTIMSYMSMGKSCEHFEIKLTHLYKCDWIRLSLHFAVFWLLAVLWARREK